MTAYCIADCGCAGGQMAGTCQFEPSCPRCVPPKSAPSEYGITVEAQNDLDAADIAKRRARDDGFVVVTVKRVSRGVLPGRWSVLLAVRKP